MNNQTNKLIPELRFPEFVNEGEWEEEELGIICDYSNGASHESGVNEFGDYFLISLNSIDIEGNLKSDMKRISYSDNSLQKNDLIMVLSDVAYGNFLGLTDIIPNDKYILNQRMACLRIKEPNKYVSFYLKTYINNNQNYFKSKGQGSSQLNLSKASVTEFPILIPTKPSEQQKIADCLSSLDEVITAYKDKLETLKTYKKGLMQNLFPQEREKVPKIRFKEFENDGDWVEDKLGDIGKFSKGKGISKNDIEKNGKYDCLRYGELYTTYGEIIDEIVSKTNLNDNELVFSEANDVILPSSGETQIDIAKASCIIKKGVAIGGDINIFKSTLNGVFLSYYLNSAKKMEIAKLSQGISVVHLYSSQLENLIINYPLSNDHSQKEQQKIADTLSSLDRLIKEQSNKIEELKLHKKGLMQGLFPKAKN